MLEIRRTGFRNRPISKPPSDADVVAALARERMQSAWLRRGSVDDDIFQEVSLRAFGRAKQFIGSDLATLTGWVHVIHTHTLIDAHRKVEYRAKTVREVPLISNGGTWEPRTQGAAELAAANAIFSDVETRVAQLPRARAEVAYLCLFEDLTAAEIAKTLDIPLGTAKTRIATAKRELRSALAEHAPIFPAKTSAKTPCKTLRRRRPRAQKPPRKFKITEFNVTGRTAHEAKTKIQTTDWSRF